MKFNFLQKNSHFVNVEKIIYYDYKSKGKIIYKRGDNMELKILKDEERKMNQIMFLVNIGIPILVDIIYKHYYYINWKINL